MSTNRLHRSLAVLAAIVVLALPTGSALAKPIIEWDRSAGRSAPVVRVTNVSRALSASREAYHALKIEQAELAAGGGRRSKARAQSTSQVAVGSAGLNRYAAFKERQIQRMLDGE